MYYEFSSNFGDGSWKIQLKISQFKFQCIIMTKIPLLSLCQFSPNLSVYFDFLENLTGSRDPLKGKNENPIAFRKIKGKIGLDSE